MNNKTLKNLGILFFVLVLLAAFQFIRPRFSAPASGYEQHVKGIKTDSVSSIEVSQKEASASVKLVKENNVWKANGKKADMQKVTDLLKFLVAEPKAERIAESSSRHTELKVSDDVATKIHIGDLDIRAGNSSIDGTYIRFAGSDPVYYLSGLQSSYISADAKDWYDKTIVRFEQNTANKLEFDKSGTRYSLEQKDGKWMLDPENKEAAKEKVEAMLATLSNFTAATIVDKDTVVKYSQTPELTVAISYKNGKETLKFFKGEGEYLVQRESDKEYFTVSEFSTKDLFLTAEELKK